MISDPAIVYDPYNYWEQFDEDDFDHKISKHNRRNRKDEADFMKVNSRGLKDVILPILNKQNKEAIERKRRK